MALGERLRSELEGLRGIKDPTPGYMSEGCKKTHNNQELHS